MATISDPRPADVTAQIKTLQAALQRAVPLKTADNLIVGTWNVRGFDKMSPVWRSGNGASPIRDLSNVLCIAEIVRAFDVVAIQEVRQSGVAFRAVIEALGEGWAYLVTDVTRGNAGNSERLAFVYDTARVQPGGLACELVVAAEQAGIGGNAFSGQFARTPYGASFVRNALQFTLVTLHVLWGKNAGARVGELTAIAEWLAQWSGEKDTWGGNLIALGDFNIDRRDSPLFQAFTSTGLKPPAQLDLVPRTIFDDPDPTVPNKPGHFYDQLAWFDEQGDGQTLTGLLRNAGMFDFTTGLVPAASQQQLSFRISDHYPLWCEYAVGV